MIYCKSNECNIQLNSNRFNFFEKVYKSNLMNIHSVKEDVGPTEGTTYASSKNAYVI